MASTGTAVAELTVPVRGDLTPLMADLAEARRALESFNSSISTSSSSGGSTGDATAEVTKLQKTLSAANDNVQQLQKSFTSMSGTATGSLEKTWTGINQLSASVAVATAGMTQLAATTATAASEVGALNAATNSVAGRLTSTNAQATNLTNTSKKLGNNLNDASNQLDLFGVKSYQLRNVAQQMSQVSQQTQVTGNFLAALAIQLPDVTAEFGPLGIGIGIVAGIALQYIADIVGMGAGANKTLEDQAKLIASVGEAWGDAVPAIQSYLDLQDQVKNAKDLKDATQILNDETTKSIKGNIDDIRQSFAELLNQLNTLGVNQGVVQNLQQAFDSFVTSAKAGKDATKDVQSVQDALATAIETSGLPALTDFANQFDVVTRAAKVAAGAIADANKQADALNNTAAKTQSDLQNTIQNGANPANFYDRTTPKNVVTMDNGSFAAIPTPGDRPSPYGFATPKAPGLSKAQKTAAQQAKEYQGLVTSSQQYIDKQKLLSDALGMTEEQSAKLTAEQKLLDEAQTKNITLTPQQTEQLKGLADQMAEAQVQTKRLTEAYNEGKQITEGFFTTLGDSLANGESLWKSFGDAAVSVLNNIAQKLLTMAADGVWNSIWNAGGASLFGGGGATGGAAGLVASLFGGHATGTSFSSGGWKMVGEEGPELMNVPGGSQVIPNNRINAPGAPSLGGGSGSAPAPQINVYVQNPTGNTEIDQMVSKGVGSALKNYDKHTLPVSMKRVNGAPRQRG